jgi:hypothetical protein
MTVILATEGAEIRTGVKSAWANREFLSPKNPSQKRAGGVAQSVGPMSKT